MVRIGLWVVAAVVIVAFWLWFGGTGRPVTPEEAMAILDRVPSAEREAARGGNCRENIAAWAAKDDGRAFFMLNQETLAGGPDGQKADEAYAVAVIQMLLERGSFPVFVGYRLGLAIGEAGADVDRVAIVRYRSLRDFLDMVTDPRMETAAPQKWASLRHTEVYPVSGILAVWPFRIVVVLIVALAALALDRVIARR